MTALTPQQIASIKVAGDRIESIYKIYAQSFTNPAHLQRILTEAQVIVDTVLSRESR